MIERQWIRSRGCCVLVYLFLIMESIESHPGCKFVPPTVAENDEIQRSLLRQKLSRSSPIFCTQCIEVNTYVTVFNDGVSGGIDVTQETVRTQMSVMNERFNSTPFIFNLVRANMVTDAALYSSMEDKEAEIGKVYRQGGLADLNVYFGGVNSGSVAFFPPVLAEDTSFFEGDGVFVAIDTILGGASVCCNQGLTLVHEVGHW